MQETLLKTKKRYTELTHVGAKEMMLKDVIPLLSMLDNKLNAAMEAIDGNFSDIFENLNISSETNFLDLSFSLVGEMSAFLDELMVAAGYFKPNESGAYVVSDTMPEEVGAKLLSIQAKSQEWHEQFLVARANAEDDEDYDDDDYDEDDDGDDDGDDGGDDNGAGHEAEVVEMNKADKADKPAGPEAVADAATDEKEGTNA